MDLSNRSLLILYGTETGNSQEIAEELGWAAERLRFRTAVEQMNDVGLKDLVQYTLVVFVTSTTGQGEVPRNAAAFWKSLLRKKLHPGCLNQLNFTVFGLGDSSYPKFNWAARKLQKRLLQLGAVEFYPAGEADERHENGIDSIYLPWLRDLKRHFLASFPLPDNIQPIPDNVLLPPKYPITVVMGDATMENPPLATVQDVLWATTREKNAACSHIDNPRDEQYQLDEDRNRSRHVTKYARSGEVWCEDMFKKIICADRLDKDSIIRDHPQKYLLEPAKDSSATSSKGLIPIPGSYRAVVKGNFRLTPEDHWQDTRLVKLELHGETGDGSDLPEITPGSTVVIHPKNFANDVDGLIDRMDWQTIADKQIKWRGVDGQGIVRPRKLFCVHDATLRDLLIHNLDINAIPTRLFLKKLSQLAKDELEKERLTELTHESNTHEFYDYTSRPRRTILELLQDFPSVMIPLERVLELFPVIRGREFSIANGGVDMTDRDRKDVRIVRLLVSLVEYKTIIRKPRQGLCSRYIKHLEPWTLMNVNLHLKGEPPSGSRNAARPLIAIATGTGVAPIRSLLEDRASYAAAGPELLFFGCRNKKADFYFHKDWPAFETLKVFPAFSRDPMDPADQEACDPYSEIDRLADLPQEYHVLEPLDSGKTGWIKTAEYDKGKMYVQHLIRKHHKTVCELLTHDLPPIITVCGNAGRMPVSVRQALLDALILGGKVDKHKAPKEKYEEAEALLKRAYYWQETW